MLGFNIKFLFSKLTLLSVSEADGELPVIEKYDELLKWHDLKEKGVITEEEFEAKKKQILGL